MLEPDSAAPGLQEAAIDHEEATEDVDDWRTRPPKPPPRRPRYMRIIDELASRPDEPDDEPETQPSAEHGRSASPPEGVLRSSRRIPREVTYEIMRASPELASVYRDARADYADAIFAWWHAAPRERWDAPRDLDYELVRLDPRVRRAERALVAVDARLSAAGKCVKSATVRNDGSARRTMMDEAERLDAEWQAERAAAPKKRKRGRKKAVEDVPVEDVPVPVPPPPDRHVEAPTPASTASTARTSLSAEAISDYSATSPEPEDSELDAYRPSYKVKVDVAATTAAASKRRKAA